MQKGEFKGNPDSYRDPYPLYVFQLTSLTKGKYEQKNSNVSYFNSRNIANKVY